MKPKPKKYYKTSHQTTWQREILQGIKSANRIFIPEIITLPNNQSIRI
jgi:hypothetical protein